MQTTIAAVGDIMLGDHPVRFGHGVRSKTKIHGVEFLLSSVREILRDADLTFGNLEVCHSDLGLIDGHLPSEEFRGSPEAIPVLRDAGFDVLSVANNHAMEHGLGPFWDTARLLKQHGIFPAGVDDQNVECTPFEFDTCRGRGELLSFSLRPENYFMDGAVPYSHRADGNADEERILAEVFRARKRSELVIVSLHWGEEFLDYPSARQVILAHRIIDSGASILLGHHPHVLQGVEFYHGGVIAYSLGNFIFDMWQSPTRISMILRLAWSSDGLDCDILPARIDANYRPTILDGSSKSRALAGILNLGNKLQGLYLGRPVESWSSDEIRNAQAAYAKEARLAAQRHRFENYAFFLTHLHKYHPSVLRQSLSRFVDRRVESLTSTN